jgi:hypothetical protein
MRRNASIMEFGMTAIEIVDEGRGGKLVEVRIEVSWKLERQPRWIAV